jgi:protein TonB
MNRQTGKQHETSGELPVWSGVTIPVSPDGLVQKATRRVNPEYPPLARAARISGSVTVEVYVNEEGQVISAEAKTGHPLLKAAAVEAAKQWLFAPTKQQGIPVGVWAHLVFNFALPEG